MKHRRRILWLQTRLQHLPILPLKWLIPKSYRENVVARHAGIALVEPNGSARLRDAFVASTRAALDMIRDVDPRRLALVQRNLQCIVCEPLVRARGVYDPIMRGCRADIEQHGVLQTAGADQWPEARLGATIVHEAAHGRLWAAGF
ncbi:MAG: hypothetical protein FJX72_22215, partial [Armatimonadetes bacterium]|nr:hypothetical protein [Armatimonadota bacterium]